MTRTDQHGDRERPRARPSRSSYSSEVQWCSLALTEPQKADFAVFMTAKQEQLDAELATWLEDDKHRLSIAFDAYSSCFRASMIAGNEDKLNANKILTARSPNLWRAVYIAVYKHCIVFEGDWLTDQRDSNRDFEG